MTAQSSNDPASAKSADSLVAEAYDELRSLAERFMAGERPNHTLQPTALVHEAYLRLAGQKCTQWKNTAHFKAMAATMIRRILIDYARGRAALVRGGGRLRLSLDDAAGIVVGRDLDLLALDEALQRFAECDERRARVVEA